MWFLCRADLEVSATPVFQKHGSLVLQNHGDLLAVRVPTGGMTQSTRPLDKLAAEAGREAGHPP